MTENQQIFFKEISKEELIKMWNNPDHKTAEFVRIYNDETEGVIDDLDELETCSYDSLAYLLTNQEISSNKTEAYAKLYKKLEEARAHLIKSPVVEGIITDVMDAINYIQALGF